MRTPLPIVALVAALLTFGTGGSAQTQQPSQPVPDAPQPQKKPAPKPQPSDSKPQPCGSTCLQAGGQSSPWRCYEAGG